MQQEEPPTLSGAATPPAAAPPDYDAPALDRAFAALHREVLSVADTLSGPDAARNAAEQFRLYWLGRRQGRLKALSEAWLKAAPAEARRTVGQRFNQLKDAIEQALATLETRGNAELLGHLETTLLTESVDITRPGAAPRPGAGHPLIETLHALLAVFERMGYSVATGPEVETDYYNFEALNFPPGHPARDTQDTLVVAHQQRKPGRERLLMRTHTSPVQIRSMEQQPPPLRLVIPGKVHRNDAADATHSPVFHQIEGLCVDENITFADLKGTLDHAMREFFGPQVRTRFFPSFFPFTEPSADVQISCPFCAGKGCRKCKHSGWIELLGCGMVHPEVFRAVQPKQPAYDPTKISGFAFGMGVDRIAMMKYGMSDIGLLYGGDARFLEQFA